MNLEELVRKGSADLEFLRQTLEGWLELWMEAEVWERNGADRCNVPTYRPRCPPSPSRPVEVQTECYVVVEDCGVMVNPTLVVGQIIGRWQKG